MKRIAFARFAGIAAGAAMVLGVASPAAAQTAAQLQAQIQLLMAQLQQLQGGATSAAITSDLTVGSSGSQVVALQSALVAQGFLTMPAGVPMGYFGALTKDAVMKWQASKGLPATGYFGPLSRAQFGGVTGGTTGTVTGGTVTSGGTTGGALMGGAGSIDNITAISNLSGEEVGEGEEDVEIAGIEIENGEESDIRLTAVRLDFSTQPGNDDLDDFITEVAVMLDGKVVAREDAEEFNDDNEWTKTITLDSGAVIRAGDTADLTVAVSAVSNIDTDDAGDDWALDFINVRFVDAQGASITDTVTYTAVTWDVTTFATAADVEMNVALSDDDEINEAHIVNVDDTDDTDDVEVLSFTIEAEGSDLTIDSLPVTFVGTGVTNLDDMISRACLLMDGDELDCVTVETDGGTTWDAANTFEDLDVEIEEGDEVTFVVTVDVNDIEAGTFDEGDTITASLDATDVNDIDAEDESGENVSDTDATGTASGEAIGFYDVGIMVSFVSATESVQVDEGADDDTGTFVIKFRVEAFDGDVIVADSGAATTVASVTGIDEDSGNTSGSSDPAGGIVYRLLDSGSATHEDVSSIVTYTTSGGASSDTNGFVLTDGEYAEVTLTVIRTNDAEADDDGIFQLELAAIGWGLNDGAAEDIMNAYTFNLDDYETDPVSLN